MGDNAGPMWETLANFGHFTDGYGPDLTHSVGYGLPDSGTLGHLTSGSGPDLTRSVGSGLLDSRTLGHLTSGSGPDLTSLRNLAAEVQDNDYMGDNALTEARETLANTQGTGR